MQPRIYQKLATRFLTTRPGTILGDRVGLGKTATAVWAAIEVAERNPTDTYILVICPKNLRSQWAGEIKKAERAIDNDIVVDYFEPEQVVLVQPADAGPARRYYLSYYQQFQCRIAVDPLAGKIWDVLIVDEAHKIKNNNAQRTVGIKNIQARYKWALTGTPIADKPIDIWSLLNWVAPEKFKSYWSFVSTYCDTQGSKVVGIKYVFDQKTGRHTTEPVLAMLRQQLAPYLLARNLEDVGLELPPLTITDVPLEMTGSQLTFYNQVKKEIIIELGEVLKNEEGIIDLTTENKLVITAAGARFTRLHQVASDPSVFKPGLSNAKLDWLQEYITDGGEPAIVFTRYRQTAASIEALLKELGATGFKVSTYASGAEGHNWQAWSYIIMWDLDFSRLTFEQAIGRAHRSGQTKPVIVIRLALANSVDIRVRTVVDHKQTVADLVMGWLHSNLWPVAGNNY